MRTGSSPSQPWLPVPQSPLPRPPPVTSLRSRPLSAGSAANNGRKQGLERITSANAALGSQRCNFFIYN